MEYLWSLGISLIALNAFAADPNAACADKIAQIENQGVHRDAFLQALKNIETRDGKTPRYVIMAHLGRQRNGELLFVDTHTGHVTPYKMEHGVPENAGDVLNSRREFHMHFGAQRINIDEQALLERGELLADPISPSLKNKLAARDGYPELTQAIANCPRFGKGNARMLYHGNNFCLSKEDMATVTNLLKADAKAGNPPPILFTYPTRNLDQYLRQVKLANDAPNACKILERMPQPSTTAPMVGGQTQDAVQ